jgi:hypothetical protein
VEGEQGVLLLFDTGFNGSTEDIEPSVFGRHGRGYRRAMWVGSKLFTSLGSVIDIDKSRETLTIRDSVPQNALGGSTVSFNDSASCSGLQALACPLGPIVTIPVRVNQGDQTYVANAFVDTGSPYSLVLRTRMRQNVFKDLKVDQCTLTTPAQSVAIDGQTILYAPRPLGMHLLAENQTSLDTHVGKIHIACGKDDPKPSSQYNDKLGGIDLTPHVEVTAGNDAFAIFDRMIIDYGSRRVILHGGGLTRQNVTQQMNLNTFSTCASTWFDAAVLLVVLFTIHKTIPNPIAKVVYMLLFLQIFCNT